MTVLITGWTSPIAAAVVARTAGETVVGVSRSALAGTVGGRAVLCADLRDSAAMTAIIDDVRPQAILHLGAMTGSRCEADPAQAAAVNVEGTRVIAAAAARSGVQRIVFASTAAVYGTTMSGPASEHSLTRPTSVYGSTKRAAEVILEESAESGGPSAVMLRIFNVWGPGFESSLIHALARASLDHPVEFLGLDRFVRDYVHVVDVASGIIDALRDPEEGVAIVNIGSGVGLSNRELALRMGIPASLTRIGPEVESYSVADISRATARWGFRPALLPGSVEPSE